MTSQGYPGNSAEGICFPDLHGCCQRCRSFRLIHKAGKNPTVKKVEDTLGGIAKKMEVKKVGHAVGGVVHKVEHAFVKHHNETSPGEDVIRFYLYTRNNPPEDIKVDLELIRRQNANANVKTRKSVCFTPDILLPTNHRNVNCPVFIRNFDAEAPTKVVIHGFMESHEDSRIMKIKDAYLQHGKYNVILVDWKSLADGPYHPRVTQNTKFTGEVVALFIDGLGLSGANLGTLHVVGFSLGAQVASMVGASVKTTTLSRITGLDPPKPWFHHSNIGITLTAKDAQFVDIIHTCAGEVGVFDPHGHVDFYPNGGWKQPGCDVADLKCSHSRAALYFAESIADMNKFPAIHSTSWESYQEDAIINITDTNVAYMGEHCSPKSTPGNYYLETNSQEPFSIPVQNLRLGPRF